MNKCLYINSYFVYSATTLFVILWDSIFFLLFRYINGFTNRKLRQKAVGVTNRECSMLKARDSLKVFYNKLYIIHLACLSYSLQHFSVMFSNIDVLIWSIKNVFLKAISRIAKLKENLPNTLLSLKPILTRCETWIYLCIKFEK